MNSFENGTDVLHFYSTSLERNMPVLVLRPIHLQKAEVQHPVLYLLHGHGGYYGSWLELIPELQAWAERMQIWIVCPEGNADSWYLDIDGNKQHQYASYISKDLISFIESRYPVSKDRRKRAISGISMGGHGALLIAMKHPELFGMVGSSSGVLDLLPFSTEWNLEDLLGNPETKRRQWEKQSCYQLLQREHLKNTALWIDCGTSDFLIDVNRKVHQNLLHQNLSHTYLEMPGAHDEEYWKEAFHLQMEFIEHYFNQD